MAEEVSLEGYAPVEEVSLEGYSPVAEVDLKGYAPAEKRPVIDKLKAAGRAIAEPFTRPLPKPLPPAEAVGRPAQRGGFSGQLNRALLDRPQVEYGKTVDPVQGPLPSPKDIAGGATETGKGFLSGLGQSVTGIGEAAPFLVPGVPMQVGDKAAEWTKYLQSIGAPGAQTAGRAVGALAPGLAGGRAGQLLAGGERAAARTLAPGAKPPIFTKEGIATGAGGGAAMGAAAPTGQADPSERLLEKAAETGVGAAGGAVLAPAATLLGRAGSRIASLPGKLKTYLSDATGSKARQAVEDVRQTAVQEAKTMAGAKTAEAAKHESEIERLSKIREQIANREQVRAEKYEGGRLIKSRDERQANDPKQAAEIQMRVTAKLRERIKQSELLAKEAGLKEDAARKFAIQQEEMLIETEQAAARLAKEQADLPASVTPEQLGAKLQQTAKALRDKYDAIRTKESGFAEALAGEKGRAPVKVDPVLEYINSIEGDIANAESKSIIQWIKNQVAAPKPEAAPGDARAAAEALFGAQGAPAAAEGATITLNKADDLRKTLNGIVRDKGLRLESGVDARASAIMHHVKEIRNRLVREAAPKGSEYSQAIAKYAQLSKPLRPFESKSGPLKRVVQDTEFGDEPLLYEAKVLAQVMNKTKEGAPAVKLLVDAQPELKEALREHFNRELFGFEDAARKTTQTNFSDFLKNNWQALQQSGLYEDFSSLARARATQTTQIEKAKAAVKAAEADVSVAEAERKGFEAQTGKARDLLGRAEKREQAALLGKPTDKDLPVKELPGKPLTSPEDVAKTAADKAKAAESRVGKAADELAAQKKQAEAGRVIYEEFDSKLRNATPENIRGTIEAFVGKLRKDNVFDAAQADALRAKMEEALTKHADFKDAQREIRNAAIYAGVAMGAGWLGSRVGVDTLSHMLPGGR